MNDMRTSYVLQLLPPQAIGNAGQNSYTQGVNFKQCHWEVLGIAGDELDDEPQQLKNSDAFG